MKRVGFAGLTVLAMACAGETALANGPAGTVYQAQPSTTVSLQQLATSSPNVQTPARQRLGRVLNLLRHRYPDGAFRPSNRGHRPVVPGTTTPVVGLQPQLNPTSRFVTGFTGVTDDTNATANGGTELEPPDQGLAVDGNKVLEIVNNTIQVFTSGGVALTQPLANATFFGTGTDYTLTDPHAVFDPTSRRWFVDEMASSPSFNGFLVAVSKNADPLGRYVVYRIDAATADIPACGGSCLPDYPQVGFDANGFYITANLFSNTTGDYVSAAIYALPKQAMEDGRSFTYAYFQTPDFVVQPSIPAPGTPFATAANGTEYLASARNMIDGTSNVRVFALSNTDRLATAPLALTLQSVDLAAETYAATVASTQPDVVGQYGQSVGAAHAPQLDGGYNGFGGGVKYANGHLYAALTSGAVDPNGLPRDVLAWFVIDPSATRTAVRAKISAQGYLVPPAGYSVSYPALAIARSGVGIMGASITSPNAGQVGGYPSTGFVEFRATGPSGAFYVSGKGGASDDGFSGYGVDGVGRWGDFASAAVDAATGRYYVGNEFIPDPATHPRGPLANWGTYVTQVR